MTGTEIAKTVVIPVSQLVKANKLVEEIHKILMVHFKESYYINIPTDLMEKIKELKENIIVTY